MVSLTPDQETGIIIGVVVGLVVLIVVIVIVTICCCCRKAERSILKRGYLFYNFEYLASLNLYSMHT